MGGMGRMEDGDWGGGKVRDKVTDRGEETGITAHGNVKIVNIHCGRV